jgi:hypothetical protein
MSISLSFFQLQETRLKNPPTQGKIGFLNDLLPDWGGLNHAVIIFVKKRLRGDADLTLMTFCRQYLFRKTTRTRGWQCRNPSPEVFEMLEHTFKQTFDATSPRSADSSTFHWYAPPALS